MHDQHVAGGEVGQEVFPAPAETLDGFPFQMVNEAGGQRPAQVAAPRLHLRKTRAFHDRLQAATHGFDLGKFGHSGDRAHAAGCSAGSAKVMRLLNGSVTFISAMPRSSPCSPGWLWR